MHIVSHAGFHLSAQDVHLETRDDRQGNPTGTGVAYVQFPSPDLAEDARHVKHKQMMGARYVECMTFITGMPCNIDFYYLESYTSAR